MTEVGKVSQFSGVNTITEAEFNSAQKTKDAEGNIIYVFEEDDGSGITKISEAEYNVYASTFARNYADKPVSKNPKSTLQENESSWWDSLKGFAKKHPITTGLFVSSGLGAYGALSDKDETEEAHKSSYWDDVKE